MRKYKPLYGTIAYYKGNWSISFEAQQSADGCWSTSSMSGYGDFPFADYPRLPIVNFLQNDRLFLCKWPLEKMPGSTGNPPLADYLNHLVDLGIEVMNWPPPTE